jgi:hypothetical protein
MSHNTFGDVNIRPHHTEIYDPYPEFYYPADPLDYSDPLAQAEAEDGVDVITHELTDDRGDMFNEAEEDPSEYEYNEELRKLARSAVKSLHDDSAGGDKDDEAAS